MERGIPGYELPDHNDQIAVNQSIRLAAAELVLGLIVTFGLFLITSRVSAMFEASEDDSILRVVLVNLHWLVALFVLVQVFLRVFNTLSRDRDQYHHRQNLRTESAARMRRAEARLIEAQAEEHHARADLLRSPLNRPADVPMLSTKTIPEAEAVPIYVNGQPANRSAIEQNREQTRSEFLPDSIASEPALAPNSAIALTIPRKLQREIDMVNPDAETPAMKQDRIKSLALEILHVCRDRNPSQSNINERIPRARGGLNRSNQDITDALDCLADAGWVTPSGGAGIARYWISQGTGLPVDYSRA